MRVTRVVMRGWGEWLRRHWAISVFSLIAGLFVLPPAANGQMLINVDFGVGRYSEKTGFAATGQSTNDYWNLYSHYDPKYAAGMSLVTNGVMHSLKYADGKPSRVSLTVTNAPGVWGNTVTDPMYGSYIFAHNRSNIVMTLTDLPVGRYHFFLYGYAQKDVIDEQLGRFRISNGKESLGPITAERHPEDASDRSETPYAYALFRDVEVSRREPVKVEVLGGGHRVPVINGMQIISRGTRPPKVVSVKKPKPTPVSTNLFIRRVSYDGEVDERTARFDVELNVESMTTNRIRAPLFKGNVAVSGRRLPKPLWLEKLDDRYFLFCQSPGRYDLSLELFAEVQHSNSWRRAAFEGPPAPSASIGVEARPPNDRLDLLTGVVESREAKTQGGEGSSGTKVTGYLRGGRGVALRWQSKAGKVAREPFLAVRTEAVANVKPSVIRHKTDFEYDVLQAEVDRLSLTVPKSQTVTRVSGGAIEDWSIGAGENHSKLTVELTESIKGRFRLQVVSEQDWGSGTNTVTMMPPAPMDVARESGRFQIKRNRMQVLVRSVEGGQRIDGDDDAVVAYRFYDRPIRVEAAVAKEEPKVSARSTLDVGVSADRINVGHSVDLNVEQVPIYELEAELSSSYSVVAVEGEAIEGWDVTGERLRIEFAEQVIGSRHLSVRIERAVSGLPAEIEVVPMRFVGLEMRGTEVKVTPSRGIRAQTVDANHLREIPVSGLEQASEAQLAFAAAAGNWGLRLSVEQLPPRLIAETFDLVTIGDGIVGGSSVVRYAIENRGVKSFRLKLPSHWEHIELTGQGIRRRKQEGDVWTIHLQETTWEGYTLVINYEIPFDPEGETVSLASPVLLGVERQSGTKAVTRASGVEVDPATVAGPLRRIDPSELAETDRALIDRDISLAYRYTRPDHELSVRAQRHERAGALERVAERVRLTTVLTDSGQAITEASYLLKTRIAADQRFRLPPKAKLWGCYVDGDPVEVNQEKDWHIVSLPKGAAGARPIRVDIKYAEPVGLSDSMRPKTLNFQAPEVAIPQSYAEWDLFVPQEKRAIRFGGDMTAEAGVTYDLGTAWFQGIALFKVLLRNAGPWQTSIVVVGLILIAFALGGGFRFLREQNKATTVLLVFGLLVLAFILGSMMLPSLSKGKARAQRVKSVNNLKQIGLGIRLFAEEHGRYPRSPSEMMNEIGNTEKVLIDVQTGRRVVYLGSDEYPADPDDVIAYFRRDEGEPVPVLFGDGHVERLGRDEFAGALQRTRGGERQALAESRARDRAASPTMESARAAKEETAAAGRSKTDTSTVAGIRSIRIDIPKSGHRYSLHKLFPFEPKPLSIAMTVMGATLYEALRGGAQALVALLGIIILGLQWKKGKRRSFWPALGTTLILVALGSVFMTLGVLHWGFVIVGVAIALLLIIGVAWRLGRVARDRTVSKGTSAESSGALGPRNGQVSGLCLALAVAGGFGTPVGTAYSQSSKVASASDEDRNLGGVSLMDARYQGEVKGDVAVFDVTFTVEAVKPGQTVGLLGSDVAVRELSEPSDGVRFLREEGRLKVRLMKPERAEVELRFLTNVKVERASKHLEFRLPDALASHFQVSVSEPDLTVRAPKAVSLSTRSDNEATRIQAVFGSADRFKLIWSKRAKEAEAIEPIVFAENRSLTTARGSLLSMRSQLEFAVSQGKVDRFRVAIPANQRLVRVEGANIESWQVEESADAKEAAENETAASGKRLEVDLTSAVTNRYRLSIETEQALPGLPAEMDLKTPRAVGLRRQTGVIGIQSGSASKVTVKTARGLQRVEPGNLEAREWIQSAQDPRAYRFSSSDYHLRIAVAEVTPWIAATVESHVLIGRDRIRLGASIDYTIKRAGVFGLRVGVPEEFQVTEVNGGKIKSWTEEMTDEGRVLVIDLQGGLKGEYSLKLMMTHYSSPLGKEVSIPGVYPLGTDTVEGFVSVGGSVGVSIDTVKQEGLVEIPAGRLQGPRKELLTSKTGTNGQSRASDGLLTFRHSVSKKETAREWTLTVKVAEVAPWIRSDVVQLVRISSDYLEGRAEMRYEVQGSPVSTVPLHLPQDAENVTITGLAIRERERNDDLLTAELQNPMFGTVQFSVTWEASIASSTNEVTISGIQSQGVNEESGYVGVGSTSHLQVSELERGEGLSAVASGAFPKWAFSDGTSGWEPTDLTLTYRYRAADFGLRLGVQRLEEAAVLQAIVDEVTMTTVMAESGETVTRMCLTVQNNGKQYLQIEPSQEVRVWSAFVNNRPVQPSRKEGSLLLPLTGSSQGDDSNVSIKTVFAETNAFPENGGRMRLASPKLDVPLKQASWTVYLPSGYGYKRVKGTMSHEGGGKKQMLSRTLADYDVRASRERQNRDSSVEQAVDEVRRYLSQGKLRQAGKVLSRAKALMRSDQAPQALRSLEEKFRTLQTSNLIRSQQAFSGALQKQSRRPGREEDAGQSEQRLDYAADVATRQWRQLQRAQELGQVGVGALHALLPREGIEHRFSQALQTEVNKPLTIELSVTAPPALGWMTPTLTGVGCFLVLWGIFARLSPRSLPPERKKRKRTK